MVKKSIVIIGIIASVFFLASCKKDHTCSCTFTDNGPPVVTTTQDFPLGKTSTKTAQSACDAQATNGKLIYDAASCTLK